MIEYGEVKLSPPFIMDEHPYSDYQYNMYLNSDDKIEIVKTPVSMTEPTNHLWKYNEDKILKDIQDYVT